jgi:pSer/pThr/pTyr-binding forkhead associated (FHA) protein
MVDDQTKQLSKPEFKRPAWLVNIDTRARFSLAGGDVTIGRVPDNSLVINDIYVSSHHGKIVFEDNQCVLHDLNSRNGTLVNNETVKEPTPIKVGDVVTIGRTKYIVE